MPVWLVHPTLMAEAGAAVVWLAANLIALARRPATAISWYAIAGLVEGGLAVLWGLAHHEAAWWSMGILWMAAKGVVVPRWLLAALPPDRWELVAAGTPRLLLGSAVLVVVAVAAGGAAGVAVAALLTPFWLLTQRRELWVAAILLMEAEVALGFVALAAHVAPATVDVLDVAEVLWAGALLAWLLRRGRLDWEEPIHTTALRRLRG